MTENKKKFILHWMTGKSEEAEGLTKKQEENIQYISVTRSKDTLIYVTEKKDK